MSHAISRDFTLNRFLIVFCCDACKNEMFSAGYLQIVGIKLFKDKSRQNCSEFIENMIFPTIFLWER